MKRRGFKWIWLFLGVLLISATCGFGYEARHTLTRYEAAKQAFAKQDWEAVIENLSDTTDNGRAEPKAFAAFLHKYVDPELATGEYKQTTRSTNSLLVPIKNEFIGYQKTEPPRPPLLSLRYVDDAVWFNVPFTPRKVGMFRGKLVNMSFASCFYRVCVAQFPQVSRRNNWKSVVAFVKSEKGAMTEMGLSPKNLYSKAKSWDDFLVEYKASIDKWQKSQSASSAR